MYKNLSPRQSARRGFYLSGQQYIIVGNDVCAKWKHQYQVPARHIREGLKLSIGQNNNKWTVHLLQGDLSLTIFPLIY